MTTVINNPGNNDIPVAVEKSGVGPLVAILITVVVLAVFFVYVLPMIQGTQSSSGTPIDVNVNLPTNATPATPAANSTTAPAPSTGGY